MTSAPAERFNTWVDGLPDDLRERLRRLDADLLLGPLESPDAAIRLACDLLVAGGNSPALVELAGESPTRLRIADAGPLVRQMLVELGVEPVDRGQAPWVVARDVARQMVAGTLPVEDGARTLWGLWYSCDTAEEIRLMLEPLDDWDDTPPAHRDDGAIRATMRYLARGIVRAAEARLA